MKNGNIDRTGIGGLPSLPEFPFDATTIHAGQRVELESKDSASKTSVVVERVRLQQQAVGGTVSGLKSATSGGPINFTLTVASDSAFAILSGQPQVTGFLATGNRLKNLTSVKNGDTVRVRGLMFYTGTGFNMIARRIDN